VTGVVSDNAGMLIPGGVSVLVKGTKFEQTLILTGNMR
jgi:hypothetical protein